MAELVRCCKLDCLSKLWFSFVIVAAFMVITIIMLMMIKVLDFCRIENTNNVAHEKSIIYVPADHTQETEDNRR